MITRRIELPLPCEAGSRDNPDIPMAEGDTPRLEETRLPEGLED